MIDLNVELDGFDEAKKKLEEVRATIENGEFELENETVDAETRFSTVPELLEASPVDVEIEGSRIEMSEDDWLTLHEFVEKETAADGLVDLVALDVEL